MVCFSNSFSLFYPVTGLFAVCDAGWNLFDKNLFFLTKSSHPARVDLQQSQYCSCRGTNLEWNDWHLFSFLCSFCLGPKFRSQADRWLSFTVVLSSVPLCLCSSQRVLLSQMCHKVVKVEDPSAGSWAGGKRIGALKDLIQHKHKALQKQKIQQP